MEPTLVNRSAGRPNLYHIRPVYFLHWLRGDLRSLSDRTGTTCLKQLAGQADCHWRQLWLPRRGSICF